MKAAEGGKQEEGAAAGPSRGPSWPLWLGIVLPTVITWVYFELLSSRPSYQQQFAFGAGKTVQFALPLVAYWLAPRRAAGPEPQWRRSALVGTAFGAVVALLMFALYYWALLPFGVMEGPKEQVRAKVAEMGFAGPAALIAMGVFYSLCHSALEEYYWRWFIFRELSERTTLVLAAVVSGVGFTAHHVLVLARYFGWTSPMTWLFSLGIAVGGAIWAVMYARYRTLLGPWLSHLLVDAAIFAIGYHLLFG